jgi:cytochrome P450
VALAAMTDFMGLSASTGERLQMAQSESLDGFTKGADSIAGSVAMFAAAMDEELELRHRETHDDMTAAVAAGETAGVVERPEAISMCAVAFFGALDTTAAAIGNTLYLLAEHPDARASVTRGDVAVVDAIEECIRYHAPIQWVMRTATRDVELHDRTIPEGGRVLLLQGSANRDSEQFEDADALDFSRPRQRHMGFGEGVHFCIGAPLARQWATIAITELLQHVPEYALDGPAVREARTDGYGLETLPVRLRP